MDKKDECFAHQKKDASHPAGIPSHVLRTIDLHENVDRRPSFITGTVLRIRREKQGVP